MKFSLKQEVLIGVIGNVSRMVPSRSTLPILGNILIVAKLGSVQFAATNLELGIRYTIPCIVTEEGSITVPARLFMEIVASMDKKGVIQIEDTPRTQKITIACGKTKSTLNGIDAQDYPVLPTWETQTEVIGAIETAIEIGKFAQMIYETVYAASTDESRPTLTGVEVSMKDNQIKLACTDGFRLVTRTEESPVNTPLDIPLIVPGRSMSEIGKVASSDGEPNQKMKILIVGNKNQILFHIPGNEKKGIESIEFVSQLIDARFPDYRGIIPRNKTTGAVINVEEFKSALKVAFLFARDNANIVKLCFQSDTENTRSRITISSVSPEMGDTSSSVDAAIAGHELEINFDVRYLIACIDHINAPSITIEATQPTRPIKVRPTGADPDGFIAIIMPMQPK